MLSTSPARKPVQSSAFHSPILNKKILLQKMPRNKYIFPHTGPIGYSDSAGKLKKCHCERLSLLDDLQYEKVTKKLLL